VAAELEAVICATYCLIALEHRKIMLKDVLICELWAQKRSRALSGNQRNVEGHFDGKKKTKKATQLPTLHEQNKQRYRECCKRARSKIPIRLYQNRHPLNIPCWQLFGFLRVLPFSFSMYHSSPSFSSFLIWLWRWDWCQYRRCHR